MTRLLIAPLLAALLFAGSGFLDALERTTRASVELAETSRDAPARTRAAAESVGDLPQIARITGQQALAFGSLADALDASAQRITDLTGAVGQQVEDLEGMAELIEALGAPLGCVKERLEEVEAASRGGPAALRSLTAPFDSVQAAQRKSVRHLKSINRKLAALGVIATATGVEAPPPPPGSVSLGAPPEAGRDPC